MTTPCNAPQDEPTCVPADEAASRFADRATWRLYVPLDDEGLGEGGQWMAGGLDRDAAIPGISLVAEPAAENLRFLQQFVDPGIARPNVYLEELRGGSSPGIHYWLGKDIRAALPSHIAIPEALYARLDNPA